jgi:hypothetical protein
MAPEKICTHPDPQNPRLLPYLEKGLWDVVKDQDHPGSSGGPKSSDKCPQERHAKERVTDEE